MPYTRSSAPAAAPITLSDVKGHMAIDWSDDDTAIQSYLDMAVELLDGRNGILGRALVTQTWVSTFPDLTGATPVRLELPPVQSVSLVRYRLNNVWQTWTASNYVLRQRESHAIVVPAQNVSWPVMDDDEEAIEVTFTTGYGAASSVPNPIKHALRLITAHLYANREATTDLKSMPLPWGAEMLLRPYRTPAL